MNATSEISFDEMFSVKNEINIPTFCKPCLNNNATPTVQQYNMKLMNESTFLRAPV